MPSCLRAPRLLPVGIVLLFCFLLYFQGSRLRTAPFSVPSHLSHDVQNTESLLLDSDSPSSPPNGDQARFRLPPGACDSEIEHLRTHELSDEILYTRRCIKPLVTRDAQRNVVAPVESPLFDSQVAVDLASCSHDKIPACEPLALQVPPPHRKQKYPHFVFGVATTYARLQESLPVFAHWLSGSDAQMVAVVVDADPKDAAPRDLRALESLYSKSDMRLHCVKTRNSSLSVDENHFTMVLDMLDAVTPQTKWLGLLDDDTFFPSMYNLDRALTPYNHTQPTWLGALSEDMEAIRNWGMMAFGGAGVFISVPLARQLEPLVDRCLANALRHTGDAILRDCIFTETHAKLTTVPGLQQHDLMGDVSGFYESGVRPLSVHHWKSWYREPVDKMAAVVDVCGDCFLQRWQFGDDTLLANGYSITRYPGEGGLSGIDLTRMEATWVSPGHNFDWSLGPLRPHLPDGSKKTYKLLDVVRTTDTSPPGELRQIYVYRGDRDRGEKDEVVELVWGS